MAQTNNKSQLKTEQDNLKKLLLSSNNGNNADYAQFLKEVQKLAASYLRQKISDTNAHEDIIQEILFSVHQARNTFNPEKKVKPWLYAIFNYRTLDHLRKTYKNLEDTVEEFVLDTPDSKPNVTQTIENNELASKALMSLNDKQRKMIVLSKVQGYTTAEIALELNMNISAVKVAIHRALQKLRKTMK